MPQRLLKLPFPYAVLTTCSTLEGALPLPETLRSCLFLQILVTLDHPPTHTLTLTHRVTLSAPGRPKTVRSRGAVISDSWCANARTCCSGSLRPHSLGRPFSINSRSGPRFPSASSYQASQEALVVKNPPTVQEIAETRVQSLGREDPLEQGMATHSSTLGLEKPMDRGAWWATVHRVAKSWTRLKRLITHGRYWAIIVYLGLDALHI